MNAIRDLSYDIEQLFIEGHSAKMIAALLDCDIETVLMAMQQMGVQDADDQTDDARSYYTC